MKTRLSVPAILLVLGVHASAAPSLSLAGITIGMASEDVPKALVSLASGSYAIQTNTNDKKELLSHTLKADTAFGPGTVIDVMYQPDQSVVYAVHVRTGNPGQELLGKLRKSHGTPTITGTPSSVSDDANFKAVYMEAMRLYPERFKKLEAMNWPSTHQPVKPHHWCQVPSCDSGVQLMYVEGTASLMQARPLRFDTSGLTPERLIENLEKAASEHGVK